MSIPVLPFNPPQVVQQPQKRPSPWAQMFPQLTQAVVMGLVQNKLNENLQKDRIKQEMEAKGYVWDEQRKTWIPPAMQTEPIGTTGATMATRGEQAFVVNDPARASDLETQRMREQFGLSGKNTMEQIRLQHELSEKERQQQTRDALSNRMTELGGVWNPELGKYDFPVTGGVEPTSGIPYLQQGPHVTPHTKKNEKSKI